MLAILAAQESGAECPAKRSRNKRVGFEVGNSMELKMESLR